MSRSRTLAAAAGAAVLSISALAAPQASAAAPGADPAVVARAATVTLASLPASSEVGRKLTLQGLAPGAPARIVVQRRVGSRWVAVASTRSRADRWSVKVPLTQGGTTTFRAVRGRAKSQARSLAVYEWLDLTEQPLLLVGATMVVGGSEAAPGRTFPNSIRQIDASNSPFVMARVQGLCTTVETWTAALPVPGGAPEGDETFDVEVIQYDDEFGYAVPPVTWETPAGPAVRRVRAIDAGATFLGFGFGDTNIDSDDRIDGLLGTPRVRCNAAELPTVDTSQIPL
jgi:hypothetical protein